MEAQSTTTLMKNWKKIAWKNKATSRAGKAAHPNIKPISPFKIRCTLLGPKGTWTSEATKKAAVRIPTFGISCWVIFFRPSAVPPTHTAAPPIKTGAANTPSEMCMNAP